MCELNKIPLIIVIKFVYLFLKRYTISTIAFPGILSGVLVMKNIANWELGKGLNGRILFADKTSNLFGELHLNII